MFGIFLVSFELALFFAIPYLNRGFIDIITGKSDNNMVSTVIILFIVFILLVPLVIWGKYLQNTTSENAVINIRMALFNHICNIPYFLLEKYKTGDYITRLTSDAKRSGAIFSSFGMTCLIRFVVVMSGSFLLLILSDWRIAMIGLIYSFISLYFSILLNPYVKRLEQEAKIEIVNSSSYLVEVMRDIPIVRVFHLHEILAKKYRKVCKIIACKRIKFRTMNGIAYGVVDFFTFSAQSVGFIIAILISSNNMELGNAVYNATLMGLMADSMLRLGTFLLLIQPNLVAMERVFTILDMPVENISEKSGKINTNTENAIEFKSVSFSYDGKYKIIDNFNLTVKNREHLAIVGGSGGGKSTLIKLIQNFYDTTKGKITYFGRDDLTLWDIRTLSTYVPQESSLFDGTVGENIALGRPGCSESEIKNAAEQAEIAEFIETLPKKYNTYIGERGARLSGGQKQRIAIARAIIKDAPIMILDEATAVLDSGTEEDINKSIKKFTKDRTTITIAHRLSTIRDADRIIVMEKGKIIEEGKYEELLTANGRFKELYINQFH